MTNDTTGLNAPNVMTPGAWVLVLLVLAAGLVGIGVMIWKVWSDRVKWTPLGFLGIQYASMDPTMEPRRLADAVSAAIAALMENTKWPGALVSSTLQNFKVYVYADPVNAGAVGVTGYEEDGVIGLNRRLTTLCHELGHMLQERIDRVVDLNHTNFGADGILKAERVYSDWLAGQK